MHGYSLGQRTGHARSEQIYEESFAHPTPPLHYHLAALLLHLYQAAHLIYLKQDNHEKDQRIFQAVVTRLACCVMW